MQNSLKSFALGAITIASFFSAMPSLAEDGIRGSYKAISCNGGNSLFEKAHADDKRFEIGNTKLKSLLVNTSDDQTAAVQILYSYNPNIQDEFNSYRIYFKDDGRQQMRKKINVHFCFRKANGAILGTEKKLTDFKILLHLPSNWSKADIGADQFDLEPGHGFNLVKVVFSLEKQGDIQIGGSRVSQKRFSSQEDTIDMSEVGPCTNIHNCNDIRQQD